MIGDGRLEIVAGRVTAMRDQDDSLVMRYSRRMMPSEEREAKFGAAFNCTGPLGVMARTCDPLLRQLLDDGLVAIEASGIGLAVDDASQAGERLWALGPLSKGKFWEIVAVPDIRHQVAAVADDIAEELRS